MSAPASRATKGVAGRVALNQLKRVFITHLHLDHFGALPYVYMFGTWAGGWHEPLRVYGPSGRTPEYGTAKMVEGMKMMLGWHRDAFSASVRSRASSGSISIGDI